MTPARKSESIPASRAVWLFVAMPQAKGDMRMKARGWLKSELTGFPQCASKVEVIREKDMARLIRYPLEREFWLQKETRFKT
jgi:hypothetical protein